MLADGHFASISFRALSQVRQQGGFSGHCSALAVFDARLYVRIRRFDKPG